MIKVLMIGKFNTIFTDINNYLNHYFNVQVCVENLEMIRGMMKLNKPDIVIVSLIGLDEGNRVILGEIKSGYAHLPVICIGTAAEQAHYEEFFKEKQFHKLTRPVDNDSIRKLIYELAGSEGQDVKAVEENIGETGAIVSESKEEKKRKCILLVDDNVFQLRTLKGVLEEKYDVQLATSGMKALTLIGRRVPDIIFLDYEMPLCDGKMTLQMIRELEEAKDVPVVFLTGVKDKENIQAVLELHPAGYMLKPPSMDRIFETIENLIGDTDGNA